jgi:hypothetical protein
VILVELHSRRMARAGGGTAVALLERMCELGYCDISHSGSVCDERWLNITRTIRCAAADRLCVNLTEKYGLMG